MAEAKTGMLFVMMFGQVFLKSFLDSLAFLGFMATQIGLNILFPPIILGFLGELLGIINFDLLSEFPIFNIPYLPQESMSEPLNLNFGLMGFESCSILLNLGSVTWFIGLWLCKLLFLFIHTDFVVNFFYIRPKIDVLKKIGLII